MTRTFEQRVSALVRQIPRDGRAEVEATIANVRSAGGTSDGALATMARDRSLSPQLRGDVCWLLARLDVPQADRVLVEVLADSEPSVRAEAAASLGLVAADADTVDRLIAVARDDTVDSVRLAALHALGIISDPRSAPALIAMLANAGEPTEIREAAAESCAHVREEHVVGALVAALRDPAAIVRYAAAYALGEQGDASAVDALTELLVDDADTPWGTVADSAREALDAIADRDD